MPGLFDPIVPKEAIQGLLDYVDSPSVERSPMRARVQGFGAGALEGLREQLTPFNIGTQVAGWGAAKAFGTPMSAAARSAPGVAKALGEINPEYTAKGAEEAYNAGRPVVKGAKDMLEQIYQKILKQGGR